MHGINFVSQLIFVNATSPGPSVAHVQFCSQIFFIYCESFLLPRVGSVVLKIMESSKCTPQGPHSDILMTGGGRGATGSYFIPPKNPNFRICRGTVDFSSRRNPSQVEATS